MSAHYAIGDWVHVPGVGMACVMERVPVGERDMRLTCKIPDHPGAALRVLAKNVEPGQMPRTNRKPRLVCVDGVRVAA